MADYICIKDCYLQAYDNRMYPASAFSLIKGTVIELKGNYAFNEEMDRIISSCDSDEKYYQYKYGDKYYYLSEKTVNEFFRLMVHKHLESKLFTNNSELNEFLFNIDGDKVKDVTPVNVRNSIVYFVLYENTEDDR